MNSTLQVEDKIKNIITSRLKNKGKIETLSHETPLLSLGIDSILALSILVEIEEEFNIEINDGDLNMDRIKNIRNFAELVRGYL